MELESLAVGGVEEESGTSLLPVNMLCSLLRQMHAPPSEDMIGRSSLEQNWFPECKEHARRDSLSLNATLRDLKSQRLVSATLWLLFDA